MPCKWVPHNYQKKAVRWLIKHPEGALFLCPGLGKTAVTLSAIKALKKAGGIHKTLVIAPKRVCQHVWTKEKGGELEVWKDFQDLKVTLLHGPKKDEAIYEDADLYVINPDGLKWLLENNYLKDLLKRGVDTLVVDELSKFKHTRSKRFKMFKPHLGKFRRRWGLTGSPVSNGLMDLFGQIYVIDLGRSLGRYITHYRNTYFFPSGYGGYTWNIQEDAEEKIYKAIKPVALSMRAEDHLDLPTLIEQNVWVTLPKKAQKIYAILEEDFIIALEDGVVTAANAAVASGKCRQVASGGVYSDVEGTLLGPKKSRETHAIHDAKTEALLELVDELQGSPLLVAYAFEQDLQRIRAGLGYEVPSICGSTSDKEGGKLIEAWNKGELPVLCGHPASMAHGLNLQQSGNHICWYSLTWDFDHYDQLIRRVWRQGSKAKRVIVHRILARDTVDEAIAKALMSKKRRQNALMDALKTYRKDKRSLCTRKKKRAKKAS